MALTVTHLASCEEVIPTQKDCLGTGIRTDSHRATRAYSSVVQQAVMGQVTTASKRSTEQVNVCLDEVYQGYCSAISVKSSVKINIYRSGWREIFFFNLQKLKYLKSEEPNDDLLLSNLLVPPYNEDFHTAVSKFCSQEKISHRLFCYYKRVLFCDFQGSWSQLTAEYTLDQCLWHLKAIQRRTKYVAERISSQRSKERKREAMVGYFGGMEAAAKQQEAVGSKTIGSFSDRIVFWSRASVLRSQKLVFCKD